ncbi:MAG: hypothetical protein R3B72_15630 [Polyangiaceae bacterium]
MPRSPRPPSGALLLAGLVAAVTFGLVSCASGSGEGMLDDFPPASSAERARAKREREARAAAAAEQGSARHTPTPPPSAPPPPPSPTPSAPASASASASASAFVAEVPTPSASASASATASASAGPPAMTQAEACRKLCERLIACIGTVGPPGGEPPQEVLDHLRQGCVSECEGAPPGARDRAQACLAIEDCSAFIECARKVDEDN